MVKIGERVFAIWGQKDGINQMAGWGTYKGRLYCEDYSFMMDDEMIKEIVEQQLFTEEQFFKLEESEQKYYIEDEIDFTFDRKLAKFKWLKYLEDQARPIEDRIREFKEETFKNPCIELDSGEIVWGYQCWWGVESKWISKRFNELEWEIIPPSKYFNKF